MPKTHEFVHKSF